MLVALDGLNLNQ